MINASLLETILDGMNEGILATDKQGVITVMNKSLERMLELSRSEICGRATLSELLLFGEMERLRKSLEGEDCGGKKKSLLFETSLLARGGRAVPVQISAALLSEGDEDIEIIALVRNLDEMLRIEQEELDDPSGLLQQDKMMSLGRLAASVVHEINNPLAGILNYVRLMIKIMSRGAPNTDQMEKFQKYLGIVECEIGRCSGIVSNLLAFSRKSKMEFAPMNVNEMIEKSLMLSQHKLTLQNIQIKTDFDSKIPNLQGDFNQLQQCLINLVFNAMDAMPQGGVLSISSAMQEGMVQIRVCDTGCGIPQEMLTRIFDPFFTTKTEGKGLGLGLSTVRGIVTRHKGTIHVKSEPGKGTTFVLCLPLH
jgi:two-component system, NtrC family, sensor kinase